MNYYEYIMKVYEEYKEKGYMLSAIDQIKYLESVIEKLYTVAIKMESELQKLKGDS